jgi:hypothetical protein
VGTIRGIRLLTIAVAVLVGGCGALLGDDSPFMLVDVGGGDADGAIDLSADGSSVTPGTDATAKDGTASNNGTDSGNSGTDASTTDARVDAPADAGKTGSSYCKNLPPSSATVVLCVDFDESPDGGYGAPLDTTTYKSAPASAALNGATLPYATIFADSGALETIAFDTTFAPDSGAPLTILSANFSVFGAVDVVYNGGNFICATGAGNASSRAARPLGTTSPSASTAESSTAPSTG